MKRSKKIFLGFAVLFFLILAFVAYDISSKTTYPSFKKKTKQEQVKNDTIQVNKSNE